MPLYHRISHRLPLCPRPRRAVLALLRPFACPLLPLHHPHALSGRGHHGH